MILNDCDEASTKLSRIKKNKPAEKKQQQRNIETKRTTHNDD